MAIALNLVRKCRAAPYDKDLVVGGIARPFNEGAFLRKSDRTDGRNGVCLRATPASIRYSQQQGRATAIRYAFSPRRQWRYLYEDWPYWRGDLGWGRRNPVLGRRTWVTNTGRSFPSGDSLTDSRGYRARQTTSGRATPKIRMSRNCRPGET